MLTKVLNYQWRSIFIDAKANNVNKFLAMFLGAALVAVATQIAIPLKPVPVTLQTFAVALVAMSLGARQGAAAIFVYILAGTLGLPIFANFGFGLPHLLGPTGGYLIGYIPAAWLMGYAAERGLASRVWLALPTALVGLTVVSSLGYLYLVHFVGWQAAYRVGVQPFLLGEICKAIMIAVIVPHFWRQQSTNV